MTENLHRHRKAKYSNYTGALWFTTFLIVLYKVKCKNFLKGKVQRQIEKLNGGSEEQE